MDNGIFFKKTDLAVLAFLIIIGAGAYLLVNNTPGGMAEIIYNRQTVKTVNLNESMVFSLEELPAVVFEVKDNAISFVHSDCPDRICVNSGELKSVGQSAACLPNKVSVRIIKGSEWEIDSIAK